MLDTFILFFLVLSPLIATAKPRPWWRSARRRATPWTLRRVCFTVPTNKLLKPPSHPASPLPSPLPSQRRQARERLSRAPPLSSHRRRRCHNCRANLSSSSPPPPPPPPPHPRHRHRRPCLSCPPHLLSLRNPPPYESKACPSLQSRPSAPKTDRQHRRRHRRCLGPNPAVRLRPPSLRWPHSSPGSSKRRHPTTGRYTRPCPTLPRCRPTTQSAPRRRRAAR